MIVTMTLIDVWFVVDTYLKISSKKSERTGLTVGIRRELLRSASASCHRVETLRKEFLISGNKGEMYGGRGVSGDSHKVTITCFSRSPPGILREEISK